VVELVKVSSIEFESAEIDSFMTASDFDVLIAAVSRAITGESMSMDQVRTSIRLYDKLVRFRSGAFECDVLKDYDLGLSLAPMVVNTPHLSYGRKDLKTEVNDS